MEFSRLHIDGVILAAPKIIHDERGFFLETYHRDKYAAGGIPETFVQDNQSFSRQGVLRGLHAQLQHPQGKLVRAILGEIFDVAVDIRPDSPTFGKWVGEVLSGDNARQLYVPPGFAHGFCVLSDVADFVYKCTNYYDGATEAGIRFDDPEVGIEWPLAEEDLLFSQRDRDAPLLSAVADSLPFTV